MTNILRNLLIGTGLAGILTGCQNKETATVITGTPIVLYDTNNDRIPDYATEPYLFESNGKFFYSIRKREPTREEISWYILNK